LKKGKDINIDFLKNLPQKNKLTLVNLLFEPWKIF